MRPRRTIYGLFLFAALFGLAGCGGDNGALSVETDEPLYREGQQLEKQGRTQEALVAYLKLISQRGDQAPESHLEAGVISLENIKDPIAAIYHFSRYLELEPNSHQAPLVREQIERAKREFASGLPAQHWEPLQGPGDASAEVQRLQAENEQLKAENLALRAGGTYSAPLRAVPTESSPPPAAAETTVPVLVPVTPDQTPAPAEVAAASVAPPAAPAAQTLPPKHPGRTHTVTAHETLFSLSKRFYGNASHWREIRDANRDQLKGEQPTLRLGMTLKIP